VTVTVVFLGRLADLAGAPEMELPAPLDWAALVRALDPDFAAELEGRKVRIAINGEVLGDKFTLRAEDGDEIALLPPVSGG